MTYEEMQRIRCAALAASVLLQAIEDYQELLVKFDRIRAERSEVGDFFLSGTKRPYGFLWICDHLDVDPEKIRMELNTRNLMHRMRKVRRMQKQYEEQRIAKGI